MSSVNMMGSSIVIFPQAGSPVKAQSAGVKTDAELVHLEVDGVVKRYGDVSILKGTSFRMRKGERLALLGPSGCGKTTLLNIIAGFLEETSGTVRVEGRNISGIQPHKRNIGVVFQNYALFPHLTVSQNVAFGLKYRRCTPAERDATVRRALTIVRLEKLGDRYPHQLSGGQQQRVAIARAIAIKPAILLLDEPLSNLDAKLREEMRSDLLDILDEMAITTILVTHDQSEALSLAHRVAVINAGMIEQIGAPSEVYHRPATRFVAGFVGEANRFEGRAIAVSADGIAVQVGEERLISEYRAGQEVKVGEAVELFVRTESVEVSVEPSIRRNVVPGRIRHTIYLGSAHRLVVDTAFGTMHVVQQSMARDSLFREGDNIFCGFHTKDLLVFPAG